MQILLSSEPLFLNVCIVLYKALSKICQMENCKHKKTTCLLLENALQFVALKNNLDSTILGRGRTSTALKLGIHFLNKSKKFQSSWIISYTIEMELCYHTPFRLPILLSQITPSSSKCPIMHHKFSLQIHCVTFFPSFFSI